MAAHENFHSPTLLGKRTKKRLFLQLLLSWVHFAYTFDGRKLLYMIISPWFSTEVTEDAKEAAVHHHNTSCKTGQSIEKNYHRYGTDNRPLCKACARLDSAGR